MQAFVAPRDAKRSYYLRCYSPSTVFLLEASRAYVPNGDREVNEPGYIIEGRL